MATIDVEDVLSKLTQKEKIDLLSGVNDRFPPSSNSADYSRGWLLEH